MFKNPKYSIVIYYNELVNSNKEYIIDLLRKGIVVHLFLSRELSEEIKNLKIIEDAVRYNFLYIYIENYNLRDNTIIIRDNEIVEENMYKQIISNKESEFNYRQYEIITADENSNYIVVSGAGTGKTTTMINRLIYLRKTSEDFTFDKAALITFTNKASMEMRDRLLTILERYYKITKDPNYLYLMDESSKVVISTIHVFSKRLINEFGKSINQNKNVKVKSFKYARRKAVTEGLDYVYKNHKNLYEIIKYYPIYDVERKIMSIWEKLDNYSIDVNSKNYSLNFGEDDSKFNKLLEIVLKKAQESIDNIKEYEIEISDLMKKLSYKEMFYEAKDKFKLIMIDEFQDSDNIQIDFAANFCHITGAKMFVVGDEKQSIYRFRGAEYTSFTRMKSSLESFNMPFKEFSMVRNYRTNSKLLKEINDIFIDIDKKVDRFNYKEEDYIYSLVNKNTNSEIQYVSLNEDGLEIDKFYEEVLNQANKDEYVSVLFRSNKDLKDFKKFCDARSIPCSVDIAGDFYRHEAVRDFYIMIKALIDDDNNIKYSFIETPYIKESVKKDIIISGENASTYLDSILLNNQWNKYVSLVRNKSILEVIDTIIQELKPIKNYYVNELYKAKKLRQNYKEIAYAKTLEYKINLEHLLYLIRDNFADDISSVYAIENFLRIKISTDDTVDRRRPEKKYDHQFLQCSTVHKAKGLEYDYVIMPKLTNPFISNKSVDVIVRSNGKTINVGYCMYIDDTEYKNSYYSHYLKDEKHETIGEESRLLYVAMTRCKKKLYLNVDGVTASEGQNNWKSLIGGARNYV